MKISVIIPSYNGAHKILGVLRALESQTLLPDEVVVVLDGSTDNTASLLQEEKFSLYKLRVIQQENGGRSKVRNYGAGNAIGDLLIFFDDDMRPAPDCLQVHVAHHNTYPGSILTGSAVEEIHFGVSDIFRFRAHLSNVWNQSFKKECITALTEEEVFITAANFSIEKSTFKLIGGFDERLTDAEDYDMARRAYLQNIPLYVNLHAHAWHDDIITCQSYIKRLRQYQKAQENLIRLKPELHSNNKFYQTKPTGAKKVLFSFFAKPFWIQLIDQDRIFKLLPKKLRYKLYDVIITANGVYYPEKVKL